MFVGSRFEGAGIGKDIKILVNGDVLADHLDGQYLFEPLLATYHQDDLIIQIMEDMLDWSVVQDHLLG